MKPCFRGSAYMESAQRPFHVMQSEVKRHLLDDTMPRKLREFRMQRHNLFIRRDRPKASMKYVRFVGIGPIALCHGFSTCLRATEETRQHLREAILSRI